MNRADSDSITYQLMSVIKTKIKIVEDLFELFSLEMELAKQSLIIIGFLILLLITLLNSAWLFLLAALFMKLQTISSPINALMTLCLFNVSLITLVIFMAKKCLKDMTFQATRRQASKSLGDVYETQKSDFTV